MSVAIVVLAIAGYGLWRLGALGPQLVGRMSDGWNQYRNERFGWTVRYPARMLLGDFESQGMFSSDGVWIANFRANTGASHDDLRHLRTDFPRDGVLFQLWWGQRFPDPFDEPDTPFPLSLDSFERIPPYVGGKEPRPLYKSFIQGGTGFSAAVWIGPAATHTDRLAMADIVASVRFPEAFAGETHTYTDPDYGWTIEVPLRLNSASFKDRPENRYTASGAWVSNFLFPTAGTPDIAEFPAEGVALRVWRRVGGPSEAPTGDDIRVPIALDDLESRDRYVGGSEPQPLSLDFMANGLRFTVDVWFGPAASVADRDAIANVLESLRFPPL
jgi:hypothetical protein